jgi:hypothetical protein
VIYHILDKRANNYTTNSVFLNTWCWQMTNSLVWVNCYEMSYQNPDFLDRVIVLFPPLCFI